ncbi:hypothetical protein F4781DRAFT_405907 [Annulohypoxylon bovei var. microspora]|nr:hypothetical protein F4781DRAFT_405907 [Annulohypoxylon bovei var. microspora]
MNTHNSTELSLGHLTIKDHDSSKVVINNINNDDKVKDLTDLPSDIFLLISSYLSPQDCVLCRRVSRQWFKAFTNVDASWNFMRWHFPRSREMRLAAEEQGDKPDWTRIFAQVARRYFYLRSAKPRLVEKVDVMQESIGRNGPFKGVKPWDRWLTWNDNTAIFQDKDPTWTMDDGLLVYQEAISGQHIAYDLETRHRFPVPFDASDKTIRRLRLTCGLLIIEWCERNPFQSVNLVIAHRHFATAFDVLRQSSSSTLPSPSEGNPAWHITFRSEWKIHSLGLPLDSDDRFFSAHTSTHYALYLWQQIPSSWTIIPIEELTIWDISKPSAYRPSLDPPGAKKPAPDSSEQGPTVVNKFSTLDLDFMNLRQGGTPSFREILLDDANVYVHEEDHRWLVGQQASETQPRHHRVRCTGIPFSGTGPLWFDECCADGNIFMSFCPRAGSLSRILGNRPPGSDGSGSGSATWPGLAPCWRHEEFPYLTVSDVVDAGAGVRVVARQCFMMEALSSFVLPKISVQEERDGGSGEAEEELAEVRFEDGMWKELLRKGKIMGDERWVVGEDFDGKVTIVRF